VGGAVTGFAGGLLLDSLGLGLLGITSLALVGVGYLVGIWGERMADRAAVRPLVAVAGASVLADVVALLIAVLVGEGSSIEARMLSAAVVGAMLNVLLAIPLVPFVRRMFPRPRPRRSEPAVAAPPVEGIVA
jgi:rod shape-determining protein MreD